MSRERPDCRKFQEEIWACWPQGGPLPPSAAEHAVGCPDCEKEIKSMRQLCLRSQTREGRPLAWSQVLGQERWERLAASTRRALSPVSAPRAWRWAPALGLAALALILLWPERGLKKPPQEPPPEVLENLEFLRHLEFLQEWEMIESLVQDPGGSR